MLADGSEARGVLLDQHRDWASIAAYDEHGRLINRAGDVSGLPALLERAK